MTTIGLEEEISSPYESGNLPEIKSERYSREVQYWKLCEIEDCQVHYQQKGWVVVGPALSPRTAVEWSQFQTTKHATSLGKYGKWARGPIMKGSTRFDDLIKRGGLREIPLDQMIAYKWHLNPEMVKIVPELANIEVFLCEHGCATRGPRRRTFNTEQSRDKHYKAMHQEIVGPTLIGKQLKEAQQPASMAPPEYWAQVAQIIKNTLESSPGKVISGGSSD